MTLRIKSSWILAGLTVVCAIFGGEAESQAGKISVTGGYMPQGGDPFYDYVIDVYLEPNATISPPTLNGMTPVSDSFTILGLPGVATTSSSSFTPSPPYSTPVGVYTWGYPTITPIIISNPPPNTPSYGADVQWAYSGLAPITNNTASQILLGEFTILTTFDYQMNVLPLPPDSPVAYTSSIGGVVAPPSTFLIANLTVPEPSSVVMLLGGSSVLPFFWLQARRRLIRRQA
jgi:hypothetical protein